MLLLLVDGLVTLPVDVEDELPGRAAVEAFGRVVVPELTVGRDVPRPPFGKRLLLPVEIY